MEDALSFRDIIKKSVLEAGGFVQTVSWDLVIRAAVYILLSVAVGLLLFWLYRKAYTGVVYSHSFAVSLVGMTVLTCAIIVTIQTNVVLSLGMVGALSIVRYRTAIKDPIDLMFLFMAVALGIATGAGMFIIALITLVIVTLLFLMLSRLRGVRDDTYILLIHYTGDGTEEAVRRAIGTRPYQIKSKTMRKQDMEMAVEVRVKKRDLTFVDEIRQFSDIRDVTLVQYKGDYID